eukprot:2774488-Rhodomonas_salina.2
MCIDPPAAAHSGECVVSVTTQLARQTTTQLANHISKQHRPVSTRGSTCIAYPRPCTCHRPCRRAQPRTIRAHRLGHTPRQYYKVQHGRRRVDKEYWRRTTERGERSYHDSTGVNARGQSVRVLAVVRVLLVALRREEHTRKQGKLPSRLWESRADAGMTCGWMKCRSGDESLCDGEGGCERDIDAQELK